jgi:amylosucrase
MARATTNNSKTTAATSAEEKFRDRFQAAGKDILALHNRLYKDHPDYETCYQQLLQITEDAFSTRSTVLKEQDITKLSQEDGHWFLSNGICGMSLYVDRFCGNLSSLANKLDYFKDLGINLLHLMPVFESPSNESDGGYAVSNFRKVDERFGNNDDLIELKQKMQKQGVYLMQDIVLNHTSQKNEWAVKARNGEKKIPGLFLLF